MRPDPSSPREPGGSTRRTARPSTARPSVTEAHAAITGLLRAWRSGSDSAFAQLLPLVYDELRRRARRCLAHEGPGHLLQPTALVHELYCRLAASPPAVDWRDRGHFFAVAARAMREILVDDARARARRKRGGRIRALSLSDVGELAFEQPQVLVQLDDALTSLAAIDPVKASLVELRFFGGLSLEEAGEAIGCSIATAGRQWRAARAWLYRELAARDANGRG